VILLGPELFWVACLALAAALVRRNRPPTEAGSDRLYKVGLWLTAATPLLSFTPWFWIPGAKGWLILRAAIAGAVGVLLVSLDLMRGINYQDSRNSGLLGVLFYFLLSGYLALGAGLIASLIGLWIR
jgi:hypothetical protein